MGRNRAIGNRLRAGGGGAIWSPARLAPAKGLWLDQSDMASGFQDTAGTSPITASGQFVARRNDKFGLGNNVTQATAASRPEWDVISGISSDFTDGSNDSYACASFVAGTMAASMDMFITLKRSSAAAGIVAYETAAGNWIGAIQSGGSAAAVNLGGSATWSCWVNGSQVGTTGTTTNGQLHTALTVGTYFVLEIRDLDLHLFTNLGFGGYGGTPLGADNAQVVLCPSESTANRNLLRTFCGAKAGLTL